METLEYYKLKDELSGLIKDEIAKSLGNERDLQQRYIGIGLKVAAAGIAAAVVALSVFGIKSLYEVDSAIAKIPEAINKRASEEVTARFNSGQNPVARYEVMLLESSARSIAAALVTQVERRPNLVLEDRLSDVIVRALKDNEVGPTTKLSLIDAMSTQKIRSVSPSVDQTVIAVVQQVAGATPVNEANLLRCLKYFSFRGPERFTTEVEKILDARSGISSVRLAIARYAMALRKDGDDLARKLEKLNDQDVKYLMHIRSLKTGDAKQLDRQLFDGALARAFNNEDDNRLSLANMIDHVSAIRGLENSSELATQVLDSIRTYATTRQITLAVADDSPDRMSFRFYTAAGDEASARIDRNHFGVLIRLATTQIKAALKQSNGEFTDPIKQAMDFWLPWLASDIDSDSRKAGGFNLVDVRKFRFVSPDGNQTSGSALFVNKATITTQGRWPETKVVMKWANDIGNVVSTPITTIVDLDPRSLNPYGIWDRGNDD